MAGPVRAIDEQDVEPAVAVVIEEGAAGAHGLGQKLRSERAIVVAESDSGGCGDVGELKIRAAAAPRTAGLRRRKKRPARHGILTSPWRMA